ncbi:hypothetical protein [Phytohalomonas tamaricis]|uniref:hypothetical protein n=1 Tax=Phytohalomonas tamaricis TaxID=2081032 RepID=UPI000D0B6213|nr:hypothetical protein [Phytohalomonas tamaricis]
MSQDMTFLFAEFDALTAAVFVSHQHRVVGHGGIEPLDRGTAPCQQMITRFAWGELWGSQHSPSR